MGPLLTHRAEDHLVEESPMEIRLQGVPIAVVMRTPGQEEDLTLGFAITEGIVEGPREIAGVRPIDSGDRFEVELASGVEIDPEQFRRNTYTSSSCGVCGKASIDAVLVSSRPLPQGPELKRETITSLPALLREAQASFTSTGGSHAAGLFNTNGELLAFAEDVGRHNAVDKAVGAMARRRWPLGELILMVSGRVSFEIVQKAAVAGIPVVAGISAASTLAADLAEEVGLTLAGFVRGEELVVYAGARRFN
jgi:FdhD protein